MLKADVTKEHTEIQCVGSIPDICSDLTHIIHGLIGKMEETDSKLALSFKVTFLAGIIDGVVYGEDREHMNHYIELAKSHADEMKKHEDVAKKIAKQIEQLKEIRDLLKAMQEENEQGENEDEAE